jgi:tetratricopeptide (TPR) repeat protein
VRRCGPLLLLVLLGAAAAAQAPADRGALVRLRDSLATVSDTTTLLAREALAIDSARVDRDNAMRHLQLGLLALRLAELRGGRHADDAASEFLWATELQPTWSWAWYGLGLAEARMPNRAAGFGGGLFTMLGVDRDRLAGTAFARAIALDPSFTEGVLAYAEQALRVTLDAPLDPALRAVRGATASVAGWDPELLVARGRLERLVGSVDSARVAFERALLLTRRPALVQLELARTLALLDSTAQAPRGGTAPVERAYLAGASTRDPELVATYRRDLEPIARADELRRFDRLGPDERAAWLLDFWRQRDAIDLREPGSRLAEHFRRWTVAQRDFRLPPFRRRFRWGIELFKSGDHEFDDRGIVWLRHGEPSERIVWNPSRPGVRTNPRDRAFGNETWRYDRPDGRLVLHFIARDDPQDFRLVETPVALDVAIDQFEQRAQDVPGLTRLLRAGPNSQQWIREEVRLEGRRSMAIATATDSWERRYATPLPGRAIWLPAGIREGRPLLHLVYAVDAETLRARARATGVAALPMRVRATFVDMRGRAVARLDTVQIVPVPGPESRLMAMRAEVPVPPGKMLVRLGVEAGTEVGIVYPVDSLEVPAFTAPRPSLSALLVGLATRGLPWAATAADTAWLDVGTVYRPADTVQVHAEAYGLRPGDIVTVKVAVTRRRTGVARLLGARDDGIAFTERMAVGRAGTIVYRRALGLEALAPGVWALELVLEAGGEVLERRRALEIRAPDSR